MRRSLRAAPLARPARPARRRSGLRRRLGHGRARLHAGGRSCRQAVRTCIAVLAARAHRRSTASRPPVQVAGCGGVIQQFAAAAARQPGVFRSAGRLAAIGGAGPPHVRRPASGGMSHTYPAVTIAATACRSRASRPAHGGEIAAGGRGRAGACCCLARVRALDRQATTGAPQCRTRRARGVRMLRARGDSRAREPRRWSRWRSRPATTDGDPVAGADRDGRDDGRLRTRGARRPRRVGGRRAAARATRSPRRTPTARSAPTSAWAGEPASSIRRSIVDPTRRPRRTTRPGMMPEDYANADRPGRPRPASSPSSSAVAAGRSPGRRGAPRERRPAMCSRASRLRRSRRPPPASR